MRWALALLLAGLATPGRASDIPTAPGTCTWTRIQHLGHRLQSGSNGPEVPDSGSAVTYANGAYQVSYEELGAIHAARVGDVVADQLARMRRVLHRHAVSPPHAPLHPPSCRAKARHPRLPFGAGTQQGVDPGPSPGMTI